MPGRSPASRLLREPLQPPVGACLRAIEDAPSSRAWMPEMSLDARIVNEPGCQNSCGNVAVRLEASGEGVLPGRLRPGMAEREATGTYLCRSWKHALPRGPGTGPGQSSIGAVAVRARARPDADEI